ncbi:MAG TPA: SpoIIE family protein phosphatase [Bacteroidia bacterium]|nr:SpoIIE family protein phosphatase [Bacteroidia bacterium]
MNETSDHLQADMAQRDAAVVYNILVIAEHSNGIFPGDSFDGPQLNITHARPSADLSGIAAAKSFDCIIADVFPSGKVTNADIATLKNGLPPGVPVIFLFDTLPEKNIQASIYRSGCADIMAGPFDPAILAIKAETFARMHRQKKELHANLSEISRMNAMLREYRDEMDASIRYAKNIQDAILPKDQIIKAIFPQSFVFYRSKDIVGGDFYWLTVIRKKAVVACVDCTGHGIPGALMSMIGNNLLKQIVEGKQLTDPSAILEEMNRGIRTTFSHNNISGHIVDGMEAAICTFDFTNDVLECAGARRHVLLFRRDGFEIIRPDPHGLGHGTTINPHFTTHTFSVSPGDSVYMFTDGYTDQFGGPDEKRFMKKNLISLIMDNLAEDMTAQSGIVAAAFDKWKGRQAQVDDVLVMGIRF